MWTWNKCFKFVFCLLFCLHKWFIWQVLSVGVYNHYKRIYHASMQKGLAIHLTHDLLKAYCWSTFSFWIMIFLYPVENSINILFPFFLLLYFSPYESYLCTSGLGLEQKRRRMIVKKMWNWKKAMCFWWGQLDQVEINFSFLYFQSVMQIFSLRTFRDYQLTEVSILKAVWHEVFQNRKLLANLVVFVNVPSSNLVFLLFFLKLLFSLRNVETFCKSILLDIRDVPILRS